MISQNEIDELCSHILHTDIWKQKVTDWLTHDGVFSETTDHTNQEVFSQLSSNEELASEIIKCTLTQVNEDQWTVDIWKEKLKKQGKSFDLTLKITFNYLTCLHYLYGLEVLQAWKLLYKHKIMWTPHNSNMNRKYNGRTKFYFDIDAAEFEIPRQPDPPKSSDRSKSPDNRPDDPMEIGALLTTLKTCT